jgi:tRNA-2-methylthio-N6-dimethylallyladenosine synthase
MARIPAKIRPKVLIKTFGCQMNKLDSVLVGSALQQAGFDLAEGVKDADAVVLNTCSVREHAEQRVFSHLGHLRHIRKEKPELVVAVIGCMAQRLGPSILDGGGVDIVCGPAQIPGLAAQLERAMAGGQKTAAVTARIRRGCGQARDEELDRFESAHDRDAAIPGQAFVRVMRGCNNFCSYCVVPYVRGPEVCRPPQAIVEQARKLAHNGVRQITLLGQRVNAYRHRAGGRTLCLADLLGAVSEIEGIEWIRFVTSFPSGEFFEEILGATAALPKACNYLHLPAQSGSDRILSAMNRKYTVGEYLDLVSKARDIVPDISLAGDFIVGFPGETEQDFAATVELCEKARYRNCFVFRYSPRPGTGAGRKLQDSVPAQVKKTRNIELLAVQEKISSELAGRFLGRTVKVLVEGPSKKSASAGSAASTAVHDCIQLAGRTQDDWITVFDGPPSLAGSFAEIEITGTSPLTLFGRVRGVRSSEFKVQ